MFDSPFVAASESLAAYAGRLPAGRPLAEAVLDFAHRLDAEFHYDPEATCSTTPVEDALRERHGVCQDFAHVMIGGLRSLGLPARYVSGYLASQRGAPPAARTTCRLRGVARLGVGLVPDTGWIEVDPTNDTVPGTVTSCSPGAATRRRLPVKGVTLGGGEAHRGGDGR